MGAHEVMFAQWRAVHSTCTDIILVRMYTQRYDNNNRGLAVRSSGPPLDKERLM